MQFNVAVILAAMASVAVAAETVTVYACESTSTTVSGVAQPTVASTGGVVPPSPSSSPIFTGAAPAHGVSALGLVVAGGLALFI